MLSLLVCCKRVYNPLTYPFRFLTDFAVQVTTASSFGAGTDARVFIQIIGTQASTAVYELKGSGDLFEEGRSGLLNHGITREVFRLR